MGYAAGKNPQRLDLAGLEELVFGLLPLGDVVHNGPHARVVAVFVLDEIYPELNRHQGAVLSLVFFFKQVRVAPGKNLLLYDLLLNIMPAGRGQVPDRQGIQFFGRIPGDLLVRRVEFDDPAVHVQAHEPVQHAVVELAVPPFGGQERAFDDFPVGDVVEEHEAPAAPAQARIPDHGVLQCPVFRVHLRLDGVQCVAFTRLVDDQVPFVLDEHPVVLVRIGQLPPPVDGGEVFLRVAEDRVMGPAHEIEGAVLVDDGHNLGGFLDDAAEQLLAFPYLFLRRLGPVKGQAVY